MFLKGLFLCKLGILLDKKRKFCLKIFETYVHSYENRNIQMTAQETLRKMLLHSKWPIFEATMFVVVISISSIIYALLFLISLYTKLWLLGHLFLKKNVFKQNVYIFKVQHTYTK